jgi:hypothetical protein
MLAFLKRGRNIRALEEQYEKMRAVVCEAIERASRNPESEPGGVLKLRARVLPTKEVSRLKLESSNGAE